MQFRPDNVEALRTSLREWVGSARAAGLDEDTMDALFADTVRPASRFWQFQGIETALFAGVGVALIAFTAWWIHERIT